MVSPVGFRFSPTDEEIIYHYILPKNLESDTSHVDEVISSVDICSCDPWDLPAKSMIKSKDKVWYFFGRKENKYNRGDRQRRTTKSGFWKKTGKTMMINTRNKTNPVKIGEKRVLVFHLSGKNNGVGSNNDWVMHEYHATTPLFSPNQMKMIYTICRLEYKGEESDSEFEQGHSLNPLVSNPGSEELLSEWVQNQELQNPRQLSELELYPPKDTMQMDFNDVPSDDWKCFLNEQNMITGSKELSSEWVQSQELQNPRQLSDFDQYLLEETQLEDAMHMAFSDVLNDDWTSFFSVDEENMITGSKEPLSEWVQSQELENLSP